MKKEELFETIENIDEKYIEIADTYKTKQKHFAWIKLVTTAACLFIIVGVLYPVPKMFVSKNIGEGAPVADVDTSQMSTDVDKDDGESYVALDTLLASADNTNNECQKICTVQISQYKAIYEAVPSVSSKQLKKSIGKVADSQENAYYVSGHKDLQYVIREENGEYSLWKFMYFDNKEYLFKDVLSLIYAINSADDITEIVSEPADMDNTEAGVTLQKRIGTLSITETKSIDVIYKILTSLTCYGADNWDKIDYGASDDGMLDSVKMGRYLTINSKNGCNLDRIKYTAISGMFYEYSGVAYNKLSDKDKYLIDQVLEIK